MSSEIYCGIKNFREPEDHVTNFWCFSFCVNNVPNEGLNIGTPLEPSSSSPSWNCGWMGDLSPGNAKHVPRLHSTHIWPIQSHAATLSLRNDIQMICSGCNHYHHPPMSHKHLSRKPIWDLPPPPMSPVIMIIMNEVLLLLLLWFCGGKGFTFVGRMCAIMLTRIFKFTSATHPSYSHRHIRRTRTWKSWWLWQTKCRLCKLLQDVLQKRRWHWTRPEALSCHSFLFWTRNQNINYYGKKRWWGQRE